MGERKKMQVRSADLLFPLEQDGKVWIKRLNVKTEWTALVELFKEYRVKLPFLLSPPELQLEPLFHLACRKVHLPSSAGTVYNLPLAVEMVKLVRHDAILASPALAGPLFRLFKNKTKKELPFRVVILLGGMVPDAAKAEIREFAPNASVRYIPHPLV